MNYKMVGFVLGRIFLIEAALMLFPMGCAAIYGEWSVVLSFLWPTLIVLALGLITSLRTPQNTKIYARDGLAIVALVWVLMSVFGALPFVISGEIPSFVDAFFETVSGFTTTGSTILTDVEALSHGTLFWRSFSHWIGGMGVLVFAMAVLPMTDGRAMHLMRAEVPGPTCGKISSKLSDSAKILYAIYFVMTVIEMILLCAGGMPLFDALIHAFGTAGTGGFSNKALSVGAYNSPYFEIVIGVFMLLFGINFNLYYFLLLRHFREAFASEEMRVYLGIVAFSTLTITANIASMYDSVGTALRTAFFQVSSIVTTTGYATADFNLWPTYSRIVIVILTFVGACAGSTAGGLKVSRVIILFKAARQDLNKMLHSHAVTTVRFEGKPLDEKTLRGVHNYFNIYMLLLTLSVLLLSLDGFDLVTTFTSVATCLNNVGPGLEMVGPMGSFADFSAPAKLLLAFDMLAGGLKVSRVIILFKAARQDLNKMLHSHAVTTVRFEGKPLDEKTLRGVHNYFNIYMLLLTLSVLLLSLDGFDLVTTFTSVATCLNNVGPGLEMVGPMGSFADFSAPAKLLLAFDMLAGRLELYPMLALFAPRLWRKRINAMHEARAK